MDRQTPIFIICRDRATSLGRLVEWLEHAGHDRIWLVDNASTYPPLLDYYDRTPHHVVRLSENHGRFAPWSAGVVQREAANEWYVVTDPDVVPAEACPPDAVDLFRRVLDRYPGYVKADFGLRIDDLPDRYAHADEVRRWEAQWWHRRFDRGPRLYHAQIDTTFALYRPFTDDFEFQLGPSIRTGEPYVARHEPWYGDSRNPTPEDSFYLAHLDAVSSTWLSESTAEWTKTMTTSYQRWSPRQWMTWRAHVALKMQRATRSSTRS